MPAPKPEAINPLPESVSVFPVEAKTVVEAAGCLVKLAKRPPTAIFPEMAKMPFLSVSAGLQSAACRSESGPLAKPQAKKLRLSRYKRASPRFIPTRVGNTSVKGTCRVKLTVHPHACGEYFGVAFANVVNPLVSLLLQEKFYLRQNFFYLLRAAPFRFNKLNQ